MVRGRYDTMYLLDWPQSIINGHNTNNKTNMHFEAEIQNSAEVYSEPKTISL